MFHIDSMNYILRSVLEKKIDRVTIIFKKSHNRVLIKIQTNWHTDFRRTQPT